MSIMQKLSDWKIRNPGKIPNWPKQAAFQLLRATQSMRCLPDYCIIGAQKSGTTSLYSYLALHPQVRPSYVKEIHYYNKHCAKGLKWYRAHFPVGPLRRDERSFITGEASTMYLHDTDTPSRMHEDLPDIRLLLVLRDPVDRAISHYHHRIRTGREDRPIEVAMEQAISAASAGKFVAGSETDYLRNGHYAEDLEHWTTVYPSDQFLVLQAEALFKDPRDAFKRVSDFLDIDYLVPDESRRKFNAGAYDKRETEAYRSALADYFKPHNRRLYESSLIDFTWGD